MKTIQDLQNATHEYAADCFDNFTTTKKLAFDGRRVAFTPRDEIIPGAKGTGILNDWSGF